LCNINDKMPAVGRNTHPLSYFEGGYLLKSGKMLTREDANLIASEAGLNTDHSLDKQYERIPEYSDSGKICGSYIKQHNPVYTPYIDHNEPLPPMLQFFSSQIISNKFLSDLISGGSAKPECEGSSYTINLNTLKPTRNSPLQKEIPEHIRIKLQ